MQENKNTSIFEKYFGPLTTLKAIYIIILIGIIVFFNSLFNGFVLDDIGQILTNPSIHSVINIVNLFTHEIGGQETSSYYRPLPYVLYTVIYSLFQNNTFFYHFIQLSFHIVNSVLIFLLFKKFIKQNLSFFLALVFLVHPINQETVVYISNLQDVLFVFFGLLSLYLLQTFPGKIRYIILANIFLLLSLFSKESGILFIIITFAYMYLFRKNKLLLHSLFSLFTLLIYSILRLISQIPLQKEALIPIMGLTFSERIINIPIIIFYYIKTFLFPLDLVVINTWVIRTIQLDNFIIPFIIDSIFFLILVLISLSIFKRREKEKILLFFLLWFMLGIFIHLQIIPIDYTVSNHYFYFPLVGLLGFIGLFLQQIKLNKQTVLLCTSLGIFILTLLSVRTIIRNNDWKNQFTLLSQDEKLSKNNYLQELLYGVELVKINKDQEAFQHLQKSLMLYPKSSLAWSTIGAVYYKNRNFKKAKEAYLKSISIGKYYGAYENMGLLLLQTDTPIHARDFIRNATEMYPNSEKLWYYRIIAEYKTGNRENALLAARNYYLLKRDGLSYSIYMHLLQNLPIKIE